MKADDYGRCRILLVEDSRDDAELITKTLQDGALDADIRRVETIEDLTRALKEFHPDVVLSDYRMPRLDATAALRIVRSYRQDLPFLCVSGTIGEEQAVELLKLGATDYVHKDKTVRLLPCLRRALAEAHERAERLRAQEELRASREQFLQAQKMEAIGRLAGGVAHDFNNILTTVTGYCELILQGLPPDSTISDDVREVMAAADRATRLTRQLLAFGRRQVFEIRVLDLNEIVRGVERLLRRMIGEDVRIELSLAADLKRVQADASQIEQILMNLAVNSRDAMPKGGLFTIATRNVDNSVELAVSDTGAGMEPEVLARVFEPFFTTKEKGKGTGLGLSTVYGIVRQSGGTIEAESAPNRGTTFRVRLPATEVPADVDAREQAAPAPASSGLEIVLVVEDEEPLRVLMQRILSRRGYNVLLADGPAAALRIIDENPEIALAVVDVVMPGMDGLTLVTHLRKRLPRLKTLFVSGYVEQASIPQPQAGRPFHFLLKPFPAVALIAKVRETLDDPA